MQRGHAAALRVIEPRDRLGRVQTLSADLYVGGAAPVAWPKSREALAAHFEGVPADERALIAGGNAAALYGLG